MYANPFIVGCMTLSKLSSSELARFVDQCLELGYNEFDHADIYGSHTTEAAFGALISKRSDLHSKLKITTKCGIAYPSKNNPEISIKYYNSSRDYILKSIDASLKNLRVESIHTFLIHRPDFLMNFEEIAEAITKAKKEGKIIHFGVSNFKIHQLELIEQYLDITTHQIKASLVHLSPFEEGDLNHLLHKKIQPTAWSPLGGGQIFENQEPRFARIRETLTALGNKYDAKSDQLLFAWLRKHPSGIVPVLGTTKISRIQSAAESLPIELEREDWYRLWTASKGHKVA